MVGSFFPGCGQEQGTPPLSKEILGSIKDTKTDEGLETKVVQRKSLTDKRFVENPKHASENQKKKNTPLEASQASRSAKKGQELPKDQPEGKEKGEGKWKVQVEQKLPSELQNSKERKDSHGKCVEYGKKFDGIKKQGGGSNE
ncbi:hypothetical protein O181_004317 [Austropuccinia psidii MF-1]|uniref:Uncharacterized protein n=1 Tax=Austropuccinia psidii MF-1 TaxID=1389203 RepID=A0A9Q3BG01_9BASI|nr:hypothetical protein [Austropuccinia psidii MF-1]